MFAKRDKHNSSRSQQTSLATAVTNFTKPVTKINLGPIIIMMCLQTMNSPVGQKSSAVTATVPRSGRRDRSLAARSEAEGGEAEEEVAPPSAESFIAMGASCLAILKGGGEFERGVPTGLHPEVL